MTEEYEYRLGCGPEGLKMVKKYVCYYTKGEPRKGSSGTPENPSERVEAVRILARTDGHVMATYNKFYEEQGMPVGTPLTPEQVGELEIAVKTTQKQFPNTRKERGKF